MFSLLDLSAPPLTSAVLSLSGESGVVVEDFCALVAGLGAGSPAAGFSVAAPGLSVDAGFSVDAGLPGFNALSPTRSTAMAPVPGVPWAPAITVGAGFSPRWTGPWRVALTSGALENTPPTFPIMLRLG